MEEQQNSAALSWCMERGALAPSGHHLAIMAPLNDFYFFAAALRDLAGDLDLGFDFASMAGVEAGGVSPITPLSGHILNAGHFRQPTAMAIGQRVMNVPVNVRKRAVCAALHPESSLFRLKLAAARSDP
ncbi:MAG: hypothetical protein K9J74_14320 [Sulfuritalea sp.]|nr:hypothetical protein [Sulfuritalea sp.]